MKNISGLLITENNSSKHIIDIKIKNEVVLELIDLFKRFDLIAIEYKQFTRSRIMYEDNIIPYILVDGNTYVSHEQFKKLSNESYCINA